MEPNNDQYEYYRDIISEGGDTFYEVEYLSKKGKEGWILSAVVIPSFSDSQRIYYWRKKIM